LAAVPVDWRLAAGILPPVLQRTSAQRIRKSLLPQRLRPKRSGSACQARALLNKATDMVSGKGRVQISAGVLWPRLKVGFLGCRSEHGWAMKLLNFHSSLAFLDRLCWPRPACWSRPGARAVLGDRAAAARWFGRGTVALASIGPFTDQEPLDPSHMNDFDCAQAFALIPAAAKRIPRQVSVPAWLLP
jgi:hypothetical protein